MGTGGFDLSQARRAPKAVKSKRVLIKSHDFYKPSARRERLQKFRRVPSSVKGMDKILGKGYPTGAFINLVAFPKAGKTTFLIHEALGASVAGREALVMYNESNPDSYMELVAGHAADLGISEDKLGGLTFMDAHGRELISAKLDYIAQMAGKWVVDPIRAHLEKGKKPAIIGIDSLTKFYRTWPAQSYKFVEKATLGLREAFDEFGVQPVVFVVHQKASGEWGKDDERGFGGWGNIHEMDGSIVIRRVKPVDTWFHRETGFPIGSTQRFINADFRHIRTAELEYHFFQRLKKPKRLIVGDALMDIISEWESLKGQGGRHD